MNFAVTGLFAGLLLALIAAVGGFTAFLVALVLGATGLAVGAHVDGTFDLGLLLRGRRG